MAESCDMLVKLWKLEDDPALFQALLEKGVRIKRVMPPDLTAVTDFVREHFSAGWADEARVAIIRNHCWIATREKKVIGFACYDATMLNFFGPIGVLETERLGGVGRALTLRCMLSMREMGYAYAVIGWTGPRAFYEKSVGATVIPDSIPGSYGNMIKVDL